jgi:hypothetical protein
MNGNAMYGGRTIRVMMRCAMFSILLMLSVGCSTHFSTLQPEGSSAQILYAIPEEQAFQIAHGTLVTTIPGYKIEIIDGPVRGYITTFQPFLDKYTQQVLVLPAEGLDTLGEKIRGYYFEVSGSGTSGIGYNKNVELFKKVTEAAKATGKDIAVTGVERAGYTNAEWHNGHGVPVKSKSPAPNALNISSGQESRPPSTEESAQSTKQVKKIEGDKIDTVRPLDVELLQAGVVRLPPSLLEERRELAQGSLCGSIGMRSTSSQRHMSSLEIRSPKWSFSLNEMPLCRPRYCRGLRVVTRYGAWPC